MQGIDNLNTERAEKLHDYTNGFYPDWIEDHEFQPVYAKLGKMITDRIPYKLGLKPITKYEPEYWMLAGLLTQEEAKLCLSFGGIRKPRTFAEIKKRSGIRDEKRLQKMLDDISWMGVLEYNWENEKREKQWLVPMFVPGSGEFTNMNFELIDKKPELGMFFNYMTRLPLEKVTKIVPPGGAGIGMHVIPVEKAIRMEDQSVDLEHISYWLDKYEGKYAASPCSCRRSRKTYDEGCGDDPADWCIAVGDMADYVVETGKGGRYITKEEALEIMQRAENNGFVHQTTNIDGKDKIFAICNCNVNVCYALRTSQLFNTPNMSRSAYVARVDAENCVACGRCVEHCPAGAVKLGQKLCKKDGSSVEYPKHLLPSDKHWSEADWNWDYRDTNRIETYDTGTAPCKTACPAHIAVEGYLKMASEGRYTEALALIKKNNPLPAICGHICNRRCEDACTRGTIDRAVAIDVSRSAVRCGAPKVSQFSLETRDIMPASDEEIAEAEEDGVLITGGWGPKEILTENGHVAGIIFKKCVSVYDENGRFDPKYDEEETVKVPCRHVFLSVGQSIEWGSLLEGQKVELGRGRGIVVDPVTYQSAEPDIFAGGDVYTGPKFAIDAIAAGKEAAISIHRYVQPNTSLTIGRNPHVYRELDKDDISVTDYDHESRQIPAVNERYGKEPGFRDPKCVFTEEQVKKETSRCLVCGASVVDENQCIGCGVCTTKCEFDAIHLFRERPECTDYQKSEDKLKLILPYAAKQAIQIRKKEKAAKAAGKKA